MAIKNTSQQDRLAALLRHRAQFAFIWLGTAAGGLGGVEPAGWVPQTRTRTLFDFGVDDTNNNLQQAGYSQAPQIGLTTAYKGGAWGDKVKPGDGQMENTELRLLGLGFMVAGPARFLAAASAAASAPAWTAALCNAYGGDMADSEQALMDTLFMSAMRCVDIQLLPDGIVSGCAPFLALSDMTAPGTGWNQSNVTGMGFNAPNVRFGFNQEIYVERTSGDNDFHPNRLQLTWNQVAGAGVNDVPRISFPTGFPARAAGDFLVLDVACFVDYAFVKLDSHEPADEVSAQKIALYRGAV